MTTRQKKALAALISEPTKGSAAQERYWAKKAAEIAAKREKTPKNGALIER